LETELELAREAGQMAAEGAPLQSLGPLSTKRSVKVKLRSLEAVTPEGAGVRGTMYEITGPSKLLKVLAAAHLPTLGSLSPISPVTLPAAARATANIHDDAVMFAWAYPVAGVAQMTADQAAVMTPENVAAHSFISFGGFVYFDADGKFLQLNALDPGDGLYFSGPFPLPPAVKADLKAEGRFQPVSAEPIRDTGALNFAWMIPGEDFKGSVLHNDDGAFAYDYGGDGGTQHRCGHRGPGSAQRSPPPLHRRRAEGPLLYRRAGPRRGNPAILRGPQAVDAADGERRVARVPHIRERQGSPMRHVHTCACVRNTAYSAVQALLLFAGGAPIPTEPSLPLTGCLQRITAHVHPSSALADAGIQTPP